MKRILTALFCVSLLPCLTAQNGSRDKELTFSAGPSWTDIRSKNVMNDRYAKSRGTVFPFFNIGYTWNLNKNFGFTTGVGYTHFQNIAAYNGYFRSESPSVDQFGDEYYLLTAADYSVTRTINSLDLPICLRVGSDNSERLSFFMDLGVRLNFLIGDKSVRNGSVSYKGLYPHPDYNFVYILVENNPLYGYTDLHYYDEKVEGGNTFGYGLMMNIGAKASLGDRSFLAFSFTAFKGLKDMSVVQQEYYMNPVRQKSDLQPTNLLMYGMNATYGLKIY